MNEQNLLRHADHLENNVVKRHFNMGTYMSHTNTSYSTNFSDASPFKSDCNSVACSVGHAATIFPPLVGESWEDFSERVFDIDPCSLEWDFLFSEGWIDVDNTPFGAAQRIRYLIKDKLEFGEDEMHDMQSGETELCYDIN